jgi:hypothetical protein
VGLSGYPFSVKFREPEFLQEVTPIPIDCLVGGCDDWVQWKLQGVSLRTVTPGRVSEVAKPFKYWCWLTGANPYNSTHKD